VIRRIVPLAACLVLAYVFLRAGIPKIIDPAGFSLAVYRFQLAPYSLVNATAIYLPWLEVIAAILILWPRSRDAASLLITILLVIFIVALISALVRGLDVSCGCFTTNPDAHKLGIRNIIFDIFLLIIALVTFVMSIKTRSTPYGESTTLYGR
jgi:uncharacterized membrane protein YphA (DoxX/SURF4 family)